jgi:two-component system LytT family response regulator
MTLRALIADDEPLARERLRFLLSGDSDVAIAGECRNGPETIAALKDNRYDLLFLDIQMPGANGLDIIDEVGAAHMPIVVFVTAHHHYAVKAFEVNALDYLTKPVERERLKAALQRVKEKIASQTALLTQEQLKAALKRSSGSRLPTTTPACTLAQRASCCANRSSNSPRRSIPSGLFACIAQRL